MLEPSQTTYAQRFYLLDDSTGNPALCRHIQIRFDWAAENTANELLSLSVYGGFMQEV